MSPCRRFSIEQPSHPMAQEFLTKAKKLPDPFPIGLVAGIGVGVLAILGLGIGLFMRGRHRNGGTPGGSAPAADGKPVTAASASEPAVQEGAGVSLVGEHVATATLDPPVEENRPSGFQAPAYSGARQQESQLTEPLEVSAATFCPSCGTKVVTDASFCAHCGKPVARLP